MLKKTITYTDYDGRERTEDFYFNLTKAELIEMDFSAKGGMQKLLEQITETNDRKRLIELVKDLILRSYGVKSEDGRRFIKTKELSEEFSQTEAFSELFMEVGTDDGAAVAFVKGILPQGLAAEVDKAAAENLLAN